MEQTCITVCKYVEDFINNINMKKINTYFEKQKVAVYYDGFLYLSSGVVPFNPSVRESIVNLKDYAILNYEDLNKENIVNVGLFVRQMVVNDFYKKHDRRIPNDLLALQYPNIYLNLDYMRYERQLLIKSYSATDNYVKLNYFRMFLNVRDLRRQLIGNEFSMLEYGLETILGLADYTMYKIINYYDKKLNKNRIKDIIRDFSLIGLEHLDFRHANLYSGLFMTLIMNDLGIDVEQLFESDHTFYQVLTKKINFIREPIAFKSDKNLVRKVADYEQSVSEKFAVFFDNSPKRVNGYYQIFSYDPNRIFVDKDNLYHESFVILKNLLNNELIKIEGPVITKILDNSFDIVTSYFYLEVFKHKKKKR